MAGPELTFLDDAITRALHEDLAGGDVTAAACVPVDAQARGRIVAKSALTLAGMTVAGRTFSRVDPATRWEALAADGDTVQPGTVVARIEGNARALLAAERTALNFLQRLSGTATLTRRFVDAAGGKCRIVDTRKTTPGLRVLQRWAVRCGGGHNHRNDLGSGVLIKENHIRACGSVTAAVKAAAAHAPHPLRIECEVTTLAELDEALAAGADAVLLDNMNDAQVREAVARVAGRAIIEASGSVDLARVATLAEAGVDVISVGALTHSAPAADLSLLFDTDADA